MPAITLENVPAELYERLQQRAEEEGRSLADSVLFLLDHAIRYEFIVDHAASASIPAPFDLPRSGKPEQVPFVVEGAGPRLPDPFTDDDPA